MKMIANLALTVAAVSFVLAIVSRMTMKMIPLAPGGLEAQALLAFANTCLLTAVVALLMQLTKK